MVQNFSRKELVNYIAMILKEPSVTQDKMLNLLSNLCMSQNLLLISITRVQYPHVSGDNRNPDVSKGEQQAFTRGG